MHTLADFCVVQNTHLLRVNSTFSVSCALKSVRSAARSKVSKIMMMLDKSISPKLSRKEQSNGTLLYPYYAGFSYDFIKSMLLKSNKNNPVVLDPWSGTGLTNKVSSEIGLQSFGVDLNPVMIVVAKASLIGDINSLESLGKDILNKFRRKRVVIDFDDDALSLWFDEQTTKKIRTLEASIYKLLVDNKGKKDLRVKADNLSSLASFFYVCLFKIVKKLIRKQFPSSNPSWIKTPKNSDEKISLSKKEISFLFFDELNFLIQKLNSNIKFSTVNKPIIKLGSSECLPIDSESIDLSITSPPYCTRVDYAVMTKPELTILGFTQAQIEELRKSLIGTTTIQNADLKIQDDWGESCCDFLNRMSTHQSIASKSYYLKNHIQYFTGMEKSISEIYKALKNSGDAVFVVQDSYYKDLHNDLPFFITEIAEKKGFDLIDRMDFPVRSISSINKKSLNYREKKPTYESVLYFKKK